MGARILPYFFTENGEIIVNPDSSEMALRSQIRKWLEDEEVLQTLLETAIPQKGLEYTDEPVTEGLICLVW